MIINHAVVIAGHLQFIGTNFHRTLRSGMLHGSHLTRSGDLTTPTPAPPEAGSKNSGDGHR